MARAPISVVIPTLNAEEALGPCLGSLGEGLAEGLIREVIVTDGGSSDGTVKLAETAGAEVIAGTPSRGGQLQRGCEAAKGEWLFVLHADSILDEGWSAAVLDHLQRSNGNAGYFKLAFRAKGLAPKIVASWANWRSEMFGLPYGDQGLLIPRVLYDDAGGFDDIPLMEDVALNRRLRRRLVKLNATVTTSADRYERDGWVKRSFRNFATLMRYFAGVKPEELVKGYSNKTPRS